METKPEQYQALLLRWSKAFVPERIWVNGERLWECQACHMSSSAGKRDILHLPNCIWTETDEALEVNKKVSGDDTGR